MWVGAASTFKLGHTTKMMQQKKKGQQLQALVDFFVNIESFDGIIYVYNDRELLGIMIHSEK